MLSCFAEQDGLAPLPEPPSNSHRYAARAGVSPDGRGPPSTTATPTATDHMRQRRRLATLRVDGRWTLHGAAARFGARVAAVRHAKARCLVDVRSLRHTDRTSLRDSVAVVVWGSVAAVDAARAVQRAGAKALVLINVDDQLLYPSPVSGEDASDVRIPCVVVPAGAAGRLVDGADVSLTIGDADDEYVNPRDTAHLVAVTRRRTQPRNGGRSRSRSRLTRTGS